MASKLSLSQAVRWIGFGHVTEEALDASGKIVSFHAIQSRTSSYFDDRMLPLEFSTEEAIAPDLKSHRFARTSKPPGKLNEDPTAEENFGIDELKWMHDRQYALLQRLDLAQGLLLGALSKGELQGYGWLKSIDPARQSRQETDNSEDAQNPPVPINSKNWISKNIDWDANLLSTMRENYDLVHISSVDLVRVFPRPKVSWIEETVEAYFGTILVPGSEDANLLPEKHLQRRRGRPLAGHGTTAKDILRWFFKGRLNDAKQAALIAEAQKMISEICNEEVSATWVKGVFAEMKIEASRK